MREYHKIETLFNRDVEGTKRLIEGSFRDETVEMLAGLDWVWTEKVDGTNIRVFWDGHKVTFGGRTDRAQIPADLVTFLNEKFLGSDVEQLFEQQFGDKEVTLYGEGYGAKIQKGGGLYRDDVSFILFDVMIGSTWLKRDAVEGIGKMFDVDVVPIVRIGSLYDAVEFVKASPTSIINPKHEMEGVVCRPKCELLDRTGKRIIVKVKVHDFV